MERSKHFAKQKRARNCEDGKEEDNSHNSKQKTQKLFGSSSRNPMKRSIEHEPLTLQAYLRDLEVSNENPSWALIFMRPTFINQNYLQLPTKFAKLVKPFTSANRYITLRVSDGSVRTRQLKMIYAAEKIILTAGWPKFRQENNLKHGDCCVFMLTEEDNGAVIDVVKFHHNNAEECRSSLAFQNENPSSELIFMRPTSIKQNSLQLPSKFAKLVRPFTSANGNITLRVSDGSVRAWQLKTVYISEKNFLSSSWPKFRRENNLKPGDWCVLMLTEEDIGAVIDVVIFRDNNAEACRSSPGK